MILQTGMRTDIPAFYVEWFLNRIKEGYVMVRNPYNPELVTKYSLSPEVVDLIAFCTKNPLPMLAHLDELSAYGQYWFVTITPYGKEIEPNVPDKEKILESFCVLSEKVGIDSVGWRYDPIFLSSKYTVESHIQSFEKMARKLSGHTKTCVISFIDLYEKVKHNFPEVREVPKAERLFLGEQFAMIGKKCGITIKSCAEGDELAPFGVDCSGCMTVETFEKALHSSLAVPKKKGARQECACLLGNDIGAYNTCGHLCKYCYANYSADIVKDNMKKHDASSPLLIGSLQKHDRIHEAKQESWLDYQLKLEL